MTFECSFGRIALATGSDLTYFTFIKKMTKMKITVSIILNLLGFFLGNIVATSFNLLFGGFGVLLVVGVIEGISFLEYAPKDHSILQDLACIKRGFFFGLFADGFKVGS